MKPQDSFKDVFDKKQRILVVAAHPDDNEVICGGLVARLIEAGKRVRLVVTTNGEKGSGDKTVDRKVLAATRLKEQETAAGILGIPKAENFNLGIPDGELEA